jgi:hypothetical protein
MTQFFRHAQTYRFSGTQEISAGHPALHVMKNTFFSLKA